MLPVEPRRRRSTSPQARGPPDGAPIPNFRTACGKHGPSQQPDEFLQAKPRLPDDGSQGAPVQLLVVGNDDLREGFVSADDHVATVLALQVEPRFPEGLDTGSPRCPRQTGHTATTMASKCSSGTASPSSSSEATYPSIASLMLATASCLVFPWLTQPRRLGHSAIQ